MPAPRPPHASNPPGPPAPPPQRFELEVRPQAPGQSWSAVLVVCADGTRAQFDQPLALLRFLARHTLTERPRGLR